MRSLKQQTLVLAIGCSAIYAPILCRADEPVVPPAYSLDRYKLLFDRFPFGREAQSEPSPTPPQEPGLADQWQLTGHFVIGNIIYVNVLNLKSQQHDTISSVETDPQRLKVISLKDDPDPYSVKAVVALGGETGTLSFNRPAPPKMPAAQGGQTPVNPGQSPNPPASQMTAIPPGMMNGNPAGSIPAGRQPQRGFRNQGQ